MEREEIKEQLVKNRIFTIQAVALGKTGRTSINYQIEKDGELIDLPIPKDMLYSMTALIHGICEDISKYHNIREFSHTDGYTPYEVEKIYQEQLKNSKNDE